MRLVHNPDHRLHTAQHEMYRGRLVPCHETPDRLDHVLAAVQARASLRELSDLRAFLPAYADRNGRVLGIALHPFLIGAAHRIKYLDEALQYIAGHDKVWFATGDEVNDWYRRDYLQAARGG